MSHSYKMVFIDLDGTTLTTNKRVTSRTRRVLEHLDGNGIPVIITTGRSIYSIRQLFARAQLKSPVITLNGTVVYNQIKGMIQSYNQLADQLLDELIQLFHKRKEIDNYLFEGLSNYYVQQSDTDLTHSFIEIRKKRPKVIKPGHCFIEPITNILVRSLEKKDEVYQWLLEHTKGKMNFVNTSWHWIEGINPDVNKGTAMFEMAQSLGIDVSEVIAFGDEWNDLEMLEHAGLAIAMGNGSEEVKGIADLIAPTNDQEGVATMLEEIFADLLVETKYA